jgi:hypothetical protein
LFSVVHVVRVVNVSRRKVLVHFPYIMIPKWPWNVNIIGRPFLLILQTDLFQIHLAIWLTLWRHYGIIGKMAMTPSPLRGTDHAIRNGMYEFQLRGKHDCRGFIEMPIMWHHRHCNMSDTRNGGRRGGIAHRLQSTEHAQTWVCSIGCVR